MEDNSHAGQGSVLLDIGGDVGALVVTCPAEMTGVEIEIRPVGAGPAPTDAGHGEHDHDHGEHVHGEHDHDHGEHVHGEHDHDEHDHAQPWPHVAVVARPAGGRLIHSAVYGALMQGEYELYVRPHGRVQLRAHVDGGRVSEADWPT